MAQTLILVLLPYGPLRQWLFYTMRQVSILGCLACAFRRYRSNRDEMFQQRMVKRRPLFLVLLVFTLCIVCEDTYIILLAPIPASNSPLTGVFLSSRNISENLMMIFIAAVTIYQTVRDLALRFNEPPEVQVDAKSTIPHSQSTSRTGFPHTPSSISSQSASEKYVPLWSRESPTVRSHQN